MKILKVKKNVLRRAPLKTDRHVKLKMLGIIRKNKNGFAWEA
jgi:hypothetical protein